MKPLHLVIIALAAVAGFYAGRSTAPESGVVQTHTAEASGEAPASAAAESSGEADTSPGSRVKQKNTPFTAEEIKAELLLLGSGSMGAIYESRGWADF